MSTASDPAADATLRGGDSHVSRIRVVVATGNRGKVAEIASALDFPGWEFVTPDELGGWEQPEETGTTFEANARIKAVAAHEQFGLAALADDSGLEVDALDGAPGVYSSRFSGADAADAANNQLLLTKLADVPEAMRTARFRSVIIFLDDGAGETVAEGACEGRIGSEPRGDGGFGYDPLFLPDGAPGRTMAQLALSEKNAISHRGAALRVLHGKLESAKLEGCAKVEGAASGS